MMSLDNIGAAALSSRASLYSTFDVGLLAVWRDIPGDFVECGVFAGSQSAALAKAGHDSGAYYPRRVHLFDSFTGIPAPGPHDTDWPHPEGTSAYSLEDVKRNMKQWGIDESLLEYHPGLFQDTVPVWASLQKPIAILRLDGDLYESTKVCIEHLYPLVSPGGWIIVDDFALPGCRKAVEDYMKGNYPPVYWQKHV